MVAEIHYNDVSNHQPHDCLPNRLFRRRSRKTSKLHITGLCAWNSPVTGEFPAQRASYEENVSIWWRHHATGLWNLVVLWDSGWHITIYMPWQYQKENMKYDIGFRLHLVDQHSCPLHWHHNECNGISNHRRLNYLLNHLIRPRSQKTSKLHVIGLCERNSRVNYEFLMQSASDTENFPFWWRHHGRPMKDTNCSLEI